MPETKIILGGPGCGKTTRLLSIVAHHLNQGVPPQKIAFVSYTRKATQEAINRAMDRFGLGKNDFPFFKTIHALAYSELGLRNSDMMSRQDYKRFADLMGVDFSGYNEPGQLLGSKRGDTLLSLINLSKARREPLKETWERSDTDVSWHELSQFDSSLKLFKQDINKVDFNDLIDHFNWSIPVEIGIVDEAQDLSLAQWSLINTALADTEKVYIAGDDDQAIHAWAGASVDTFLSLEGKIEVLPVSHRLPKSIFKLANKLTGFIQKRYAKHWEPCDREGTVTWVTSLDELDFNGTWMILSRNSYYLNAIKAELERLGLPYALNNSNSINYEHVECIKIHEKMLRGEVLSSEERLIHNSYSNGLNEPWYIALDRIPLATREYYRAIIRRGIPLDNKPTIYVGTIHSVKGGEADNVLLLTDMTYRTNTNLENNPDDEHRCFYVGATRAKYNLYIHMPQGAYHYKPILYD